MAPHHPASVLPSPAPSPPPPSVSAPINASSLRSALKNSSRPCTPAGSRATSPAPIHRETMPLSGECPNTNTNTSLSTSPAQAPPSLTFEEPDIPRDNSSGTLAGGSSTRSAIVGGGSYGGKLGGPSMSRSRTSSSGALSEMKPGYERKVGFDTMPDAEETSSRAFSFTLQIKSTGYRRTKNTRTFMCAVDGQEYSDRALEWLMDSLVEDGDEVVALRVLEGEAEDIDQDDAREEARDLLASIVDLNEGAEDRKISIVVEFVAGRVTSTILRLITMYRPDSLTVGTRGKSSSTLTKILGGGGPMGSVSKYVLSRSPIPVVVVRPEAKVRKHLKKRQEDPKRRSYHDLMGAKGAGLPMSVSRSKRESLQIPGQ